MERRIFGLETEYGVTCSVSGQRRLSPDEVARYLFRKVVAWGRSSNVFLRNGARLYLDVGSHPEYATAECDDLIDLVTHDRAGELILADLMDEAQERLAADGIAGNIYMFKNNIDSAGNSYGCHENYLVKRDSDFSRLTDLLIPFFITRQIICGAGHLQHTARGTKFHVSQRADHIWEGVSSATTRSRPIINTRDEPHADAERFRRLHVIVGDSNMSETTTLLKVGSAHGVLRMIEEGGAAMRDLTLENPIRAIREISRDITGRAQVTLANGRRMSALEIQTEYFTKVSEFFDKIGGPDPAMARVLELWERTLKAIDGDNLSLIDKEIDWVIKYRLLDDYRASRDLRWSDPKLAQLDLTYHDIRRDRGVFWILQRSARALRLTTDDAVTRAVDTPPQTTRAKLRGDFIAAAQGKKRDFTVDWVHLKLNDQAQRTILCKDPFAAIDDRVTRLIESM